MLAVVFFQFPVTLLLESWVDLTIVKWHHLLPCHAALMIGSFHLVLLSCFVYLHCHSSKDSSELNGTKSYKQLNLIKENISEQNAQRLVETNATMERDEVIARHTMSSSDPTVLISPSLFTGIDLKEGLSR